MQIVGIAVQCMSFTPIEDIQHATALTVQVNTVEGNYAYGNIHCGPNRKSLR